MERFPVELLYILGFIAVVLFNMVAQRAARRRQQEEAAQAPEQADAPEQAEPPVADDAPLEDIWGRKPAAPPPAPVIVAPVPPPAPSLPQRAHPVRALLREPRDLRRAVILMMVLGPCRAQEPPDKRP